MCAMKEVTLFSDDAKSRESAKQLMQVSSLLIEFGSLQFLLHEDIISATSCLYNLFYYFFLLSVEISNFLLAYSYRK